MTSTSFDAGAGVTLVPGGSAECFRALLELADKPPTAERESDTSPAVRVTRKVFCALSPAESKETFVLTQSGPLNLVTRFLIPRKGEIIHAVVTWRKAGPLTLLCFASVSAEPDQTASHKDLFRLETALHSGFEQDSQAFTAGRQKDLTPLRRERESIDAASLLATPEPWSKRARRS